MKKVEKFRPYVLGPPDADGKRERLIPQSPFPARGFKFHRVTTKEWAPECNKAPQVSVFAEEGFDEPEGNWVPNLEYIAYYSERRKKLRRMFPCVHIRRTTTGNPSQIRLESSYTETQEVDPGDCGPHDYVTYTEKVTWDVWPAMPWFLPRVDVGSSLSDSWVNHENLDEVNHKLTILHQIAIGHMTPKLDNGWSMSRFLVELKDMRQLASQLKHFAQLPAAIRVGLSHKPLSELSDGFLATIFGALPLVDDIKAIIDKWRSSGSIVQDFLLRAGKRHTLHYKKRLSPLTFRDPEWFDQVTDAYSVRDLMYGIQIGEDEHGNPQYVDHLSYPNVPLTVGYGHTINNAAYHATMDFTYTLPEMDAFWQSFLAELDHWGLNPSVGDIWDVIPFSFVIDWVVDVGSWLHSFDKEWVPVKVEIHDFCWSIKYNHRVQVEYFVPDSSGFTLDPRKSSATWSQDVYYRFRGVPEIKPDGVGNILRVPKGMHLVIGGALLGSRGIFDPKTGFSVLDIIEL